MNLTETNAKLYFKKSGHPVKKIPESETKTPDFDGGDFLVEVKQINPRVEELSKDSTFNTVKNSLQDAARKFRAYDPKHSKKHIVVVYSSEIVKDDIFSVWTGEWSPEHRDRIFKGGMLLSAEHKKHIDAVTWFENETDQSPRHVWAVSDDIRLYFPETIHD
jgi:hypothetical protein